jgi:hypothetical protein
MVKDIQNILSELETADNNTKNRLENTLVNMGENALDILVDRLQVVQGVQRGVVAMTLIRIGGASIEPLKKAAKSNKDFEWVAQYLIREIIAA